jgi:hypothetical protein
MDVMDAWWSLLGFVPPQMDSLPPVFLPVEMEKFKEMNYVIMMNLQLGKGVEVTAQGLKLDGIALIQVLG